MMHSKPIFLLFPLLLAAFASCTESTAFKDYRDLPAEGWRAKDTLDITLTNELGEAQGNGISNYEYVLPLPQLHLQPGDQGRIRIYHLMRRPTLSGITNVGLEISPL